MAEHPESPAGDLRSPFLDVRWPAPAGAQPVAAVMPAGETPFDGPWRERLDEPPQQTAAPAGEGELWEAEVPSTAADAGIAVPAIGFFKRLLMPVPVLDSGRSAAAVRANRGWHPGVSGVDPNELRRQLDDYVSLTLIRGAVNAFNRDHPSAPIALGTPPVDAVLAEAVHQFQAKCYLDPAQADGLAGESTLDSLGFVERRGLRTVNRVNTVAGVRLAQVPAEVRTETGKEPAAWFDGMVNPAFLGRQFNRGVHHTFARRLRLAERWLLSRPGYAGMTPVELGRALGLDDEADRKYDRVHRGHRPDRDSTNSMHTFGLAVDIRYRTNPWVKGDHFTRALRNAVRLLGGQSIGTGNAAEFLDRLGTDPALTTREIHQRLTRLSADFGRYLRLRGAAGDLRQVLTRRWADRNGDAFEPDERQAGEAAAVTAAVARWLPAIKQDHDDVREVFAGRDPDDGFLNLHEDLVVALRDKACLAWGAVDLGPGASGDMMHFDTRVGGLGDAIVRRASGSGGRPHPVSRGHPCLAARAPAHETPDEPAPDPEDPESAETAESAESGCRADEA